MATVQRFEDLPVWQKSRVLCQRVYQITGQSRIVRDFPLRDQMRRAAISLLSNIAEGFERDGRTEFLQFLSIAQGSVGELRAQLYVLLDQQYVQERPFNELLGEARQISAMLAALMRYLRTSAVRGEKFRGRVGVRVVGHRA